MQTEMQPVHAYTVDRATGTARLGAVSPIRKFVDGETETTIQVQLIRGEVCFFDQGGKPMEIEDVPAKIVEGLRKNPLRKGDETVEQVVRFCEFCPALPSGDLQCFGSGEYEAHLKEHIRTSAVSSRKVDEPVEAEKPSTVARPRARGRK